MANNPLSDEAKRFIEDSMEIVAKNHKWPYEHWAALDELKDELGICKHEDYAYNGGKCSSCGRIFPGVYI